MTRATVQAKTRMPATKRCIICGCVKEASEFYKTRYTTRQGKASLRLEPRCRPCARERKRRVHAANRDRLCAEMREYRARNRDAFYARQKERRALDPERLRAQRRASEAKRRGISGNNPATGDDFIRVLAEARIGDRYLDAYSGELIDIPTVDHIVPLSQGGAHEYSNLCVTSRANNTSKHVRPLLVWMAGR